MDRSAYYSDAHVRGFLQWAAPLVAGRRALRHRWRSPKWGPWTCESVFDAYMAYDWPFTVTLPGERMPRRGRSYSESVAVLDLLSALLRRSADTEDAKSFLDAAIAVVQWGGVRRNEPRLLALGAGALPALGTAARQLDPTLADLDELDRVQDMNSGFSKIYSLLVDGFPIYDSRVEPDPVLRTT